MAFVTRFRTIRSTRLGSTSATTGPSEVTTISTPRLRASGSAAVTGYKATLTPGGRATSVDASTHTATFTGVTAGSYTAKVVAKSAVGSSPGASVPVIVKKLL